MECVEAALKTSFRKEMGLKSSAQQALLDDLWAVNAQNVGSCDDFFVDDLLDLSNEDGFVGKDTEQGHDGEGKPAAEKLCSVSVMQQQRDEEEVVKEEADGKSIDFSEKDGFGTVPTTELSVPAEDMANLEWLSHFVDESYSTQPFLAGATAEKPMKMIEVHPKQEPAVLAESPFQSPVPAKARSKRTRSGGKVWSLGSPSLTESSSSSATSSSSCSSQSSPWLIYGHPCPNPVTATAFSVPTRTAPKKPKKLRSETVAQPPRRCSHCGVQKTPQWRTGPHGTKTLCNACGVRFKSGRLLPEYRPACSPTFSSELHSNHHRKVLEMRRKKETVPRPEPNLGQQAVSSF